MKKVFRYTAWGLIGILFVIFVYCALSKSSTCDFRGYVEELQTDEKNACVWITLSEVTNERSRLKLKVTEKTSVKNLDGDRISADQIQIGDMLDANVHDEKVDDAYYQVEWIRVYKD